MAVTKRLCEAANAVVVTMETIPTVHARTSNTKQATMECKPQTFACVWIGCLKLFRRTASSCVSSGNRKPSEIELRAILCFLIS